MSDLEIKAAAFDVCNAFREMLREGLHGQWIEMGDALHDANADAFTQLVQAEMASQEITDDSEDGFARAAVTQRLNEAVTLALIEMALDHASRLCASLGGTMSPSLPQDIDKAMRDCIVADMIAGLDSYAPDQIDADFRASFKARYGL